MSSGEEQRVHLGRLIENMGKEAKEPKAKEWSDSSSSEEKDGDNEAEDEEESDETMEEVENGNPLYTDSVVASRYK